MHTDRTTTDRLTTRSRCAGQAMIEFMVALLVVVILVGGLVQLTSLYTTHTRIMNEARGNAGERAINPITVADTPEFIVDWEPGRDGVTYTADDEPVTDSAAVLQARITAKTVAQTEDWALVEDAQNTGVIDFRGSLAPNNHFGLIGETVEEEMPLEAGLISRWVYPSESITIAEEVWMPKLGDIY